MNMGTLLGAVVGSLVGAGAWFYLETTYPRDFSWAAILIGGLAGLAARGFSKAGPGAIARGALTAAIALGCMVGGRFAITKQIERLAETTPPKVTRAPEVVIDGEAEEAEEELEDEPMEEVPPPTPLNPEALKASQGFTNRGATQPPFYLAAYYVIGTLLAYFIGKGREQSEMAAIDGGATPSGLDQME